MKASAPFANVIPRPTHCQALPGEFRLGKETRIIGLGEFQGVAESLQRTLRLATSWEFPISGSSGPEETGVISFASDSSLGGSGDYRLRVTPEGIHITAATRAGAFYGVQTLLQLLPPALHQGVPRPELEWSVPGLEIKDSPRFPWRGVLLDSARHLQPVSWIKKFLDVMALHKLNVLHWHLTEDQGWRLEIRRYPRLTEVGAFRAETSRGHHREGLSGDGTPYGGFYTQAEIREIVAYAAERCITIVPEIEMPGHSQAAIAAYPELGSAPEGSEQAVVTTWGIHHAIFNPSEATLEFLQNVLAEVIELFPGEFIHLGGDEVIKDQWKANPAVEARRQELNLPDLRALHGWFLGQMAEFLRSHGRRMICWEEILEIGAPLGTRIISWLGTEAGLEAAEHGTEAIMAPNQSLYLDHYQAQDQGAEPLAIGGYLPLEKVYAFEPLPEGIAPAAAERIKGIQAQIWTEYMPATTHLEYMAFPRLSAMAEVAWSRPANRDFQDFQQRLPRMLQRLNVLGVNYRPLT